MSDFETHSIGTTKELNLSRALAREIEQTMQQYGNVIPENVLRAYMALRQHYDLQIQTSPL